MSDESPRFLELSEKIGGFSEDALDSLFFMKSPLELYHWTMNVIELLLIVGAVWGLFHAIGIWRKNGKAINLGVWIASVVYMLAIEIPVYFPEKIGGDPSSVPFLHNEFTVEFFYNRAPLYIMALYPALAYPAYLLVEAAGIFQRRWGIVLGALSVGFVHHVFYEIFDHFGPMYGWWIWNYPQFKSTLASVPVSSMFNFAFIGPLALVLMVHLTLGGYIRRQRRRGLTITGLGFAFWTIVAGILTPLCSILMAPQGFLNLLPLEYTATLEIAVSFTLLALAGLATLYLFISGRLSTEESSRSNQYRFAYRYLTFYLIVFGALWLYALPDYFAAVDGITDRRLRIGSLPYALACFALGTFFIYRVRVADRAAVPTSSPAL